MPEAGVVLLQGRLLRAGALRVAACPVPAARLQLRDVRFDSLATVTSARCGGHAVVEPPVRFPVGRLKGFNQLSQRERC